MTSNCRPRGRNKRSQNKENIVFYNYRAGSGSEYNINQGSCQLHMSQAKKLWHPSKEQQLEQDIWHWSLMFGALLYSPCSFQVLTVQSWSHAMFFWRRGIRLVPPLHPRRDSLISCYFTYHVMLTISAGQKTTNWSSRDPRIKSLETSMKQPVLSLIN